MVTLTGLVRTLTVSPQPLNCLPYQDRKTILLNNGWKLNLTFPQFREIRDSYKAIKGYQLTQLDQDLFELDFGDFKVTDNLRMVCTFAEMKYRYKVTKLGTDYYRFTGYKFTLEGSSMMLFIWRELISGEYKADYKGKVVLDVGGFQGETAIHYWLAGAKKVIVYEPFLKNCQLIEKNIKSNLANVEVHKAGISEKDGHQLLEVFAAHPDDKQNKELVKLRNITDIINESGADIAKLDCEGAEACLTTVPNETLRKIPRYMLEIHSPEIERNLIEKFTAAGFKVAKLKKMSADISIAYFNL